MFGLYKKQLKLVNFVMAEKIKKNEDSTETPQSWKTDNGEFKELVVELSEHFKKEDQESTDFEKLKTSVAEEETESKKKAFERAFEKIKSNGKIREIIRAVYNKSKGKNKKLEKVGLEKFIDDTVNRFVHYKNGIAENEGVLPAMEIVNNIAIEIKKNGKDYEIENDDIEKLKVYAENAAKATKNEIIHGSRKPKNPKPEDAEKPETALPLPEPVVSVIEPEKISVVNQPAAPEKSNGMPFKGGDTVKVFNKNLGEVEDGWTVAGIKKDGNIRVEKYDQEYGKKSKYFKRKTETLSKDVSLEDLRKWNGLEDLNQAAQEVPKEPIGQSNEQPIMPKKTEDPEAEESKGEAIKMRKEQTEKIKIELELDLKAYAEIRYKKLKAWESVGGFLGKKEAQERFDIDPEVLSMKKAYLSKLVEYKNVLFLDVKKDDPDKLEETISELLNVNDNFFDVYMDVRKENDEKPLTGKMQETFFSYANYHKIFPQAKETGAYKDGAAFHTENLTIKEVDDLIRNKLNEIEPGANHDVAVELIRSDALKEYAYSRGITPEEATEKLSKANNGIKFSMALDSVGLLHGHFNEKIIAKDNTIPEDNVVQRDLKNNVQSDLQELLKTKIKDITDAKKTAINIKDSIFGESDDIFSVWKGENMAEIMKSKESKKDFLEKIPKSGKTFFNKLIKKIPPEPEDTTRRWIARVAIEAKKG